MTPKSPFFAVNLLTALAALGVVCGVLPLAAVLVPYAVLAVAVVFSAAIVGLAVTAGLTPLGSKDVVRQAITSMVDG